MAWSKQHKQKTKEKILLSAAKLFANNSFDRVSIDQIMKEAQLTRGAFYSHFKSKSDLYSQSIIKGADAAQIRKPLNSNINLTHIAQYYLSQSHRDEQDKQPCPLASLVSDISQQDKTIQDTYTQLFKGFVKQANIHTKDQQKALQSAVLMVGGLAISRALSDKTLSDDLLLACQKAITEF
ncbi:TetR/AcrR family transcriptional regulator [Pseudoalteromonas denitrificans]|uniref:Transcriptional regulator, TetR family n=1 Tax=Pseudoalteromonas denitrificans DSM 6059 TaxID=1123010 RepID=A0A1I1LXZ9_9GAMM|nr:TetR/AcrR family transcriptional regulator [Pseudoalteromonas denitrificans]SFC75193.1 transcriptional regulator, TetR family [Pseudoalteromonas denitrificans DSM 6059]